MILQKRGISTTLPAHSVAQSLFHFRFSAVSKASYSWQFYLPTSVFDTYDGRSRGYGHRVIRACDLKSTFRSFTGFNLLWESQSREAKKRASCRNPKRRIDHAVTTQNLFNSYFHYVLQNSQNKPCCEDYQV